jgi:glycosyltransferase involved in cell wall biosynthesis
MKILHTISGMSAKCGGTATCTYELVKGLRTLEVEADILSFEPETNDVLIENEQFIQTVPRPKHIISNLYKKALENSDYQLFHANGIWEYAEFITAKVARKKNRPYVISPHGMLYPQALNHSKLKKKLFLNLVLLKDLNKAAAVHATCMKEMQHLRELGVKAPIAVNPNPINITNSQLSTLHSQLKIGYLGRVHPRKNVELLLYVWDKLHLDKINAELIIIGDGDTHYMDFLKAEQQRLNLKNVIFTGFLSGETKENVLRSLSYLVVPSDFENFGMIVPEALIKGIPVIASKGTPWEELSTHHCGWWVDNDVNTLAATIEKALNISEKERRQMGVNGIKLVRETYSVGVVAGKMKRLYEWILNGGEKPEYVYV